MDKIRCSHCRGSKKVAKLGGMIGECNLCEGTGQMDASDRMQSISDVVDTVVSNLDVIKQVAAVTATRIEKPRSDLVDNVVSVEPTLVKVDAKKALYKRKIIAT